MRSWRVPPAAMVVIAVVLAGAGGAVAGGTLISSSAQIKAGVIKKSDLSKQLRKQLKRRGSAGPTGPAGANGAPGATGAKGDKGDTGSQGIQGVQGAIGPSSVTYFKADAQADTTGGLITGTHLTGTLPAGSYAVTGKVNLAAQSGDVEVACTLTVGSESDRGDARIGTAQIGQTAYDSIPFALAVTLTDTANVTVVCDESEPIDRATVSRVRVVAIKVGSIITGS